MFTALNAVNCHLPYSPRISASTYSKMGETVPSHREDEETNHQTLEGDHREPGTAPRPARESES